MAIGNCNKCALPGLVKDLQALRVTAEMAVANTDASEAVTANNPYLSTKNEALKSFEAKQVEFTQFVNEWRGMCGKCEFGA